MSVSLQLRFIFFQYSLVCWTVELQFQFFFYFLSASGFAAPFLRYIVHLGLRLAIAQVALLLFWIKIHHFRTLLCTVVSVEKSLLRALRRYFRCFLLGCSKFYWGFQWSYNQLFFYDKIIKTGFQWTTPVYVFLVFSMSSGRGFDYGSCIVLGSIVEDSPDFCTVGALGGWGCIWAIVVVARVGGLHSCLSLADVTFDQNGRKCRFSNFELLAAYLPN